MKLWDLVNTVRRIYRIGILKTLFINFYMLPFRQAIKLPIIVSCNTYFYNLSGKIRINCQAKTGLVRIGFMGEDTKSWRSEKALINISGTIIFQGLAKLGVGCSIRVEKKACLTLGAGVLFNYNSKIICYDSIVIGDNCNISWDVQLFDTDLHFIKQKNNNKVLPRTNPTIVEDKVWIGCNSLILKGSKIKKESIVAAKSIVTHQTISEINTLVAGAPAKIIKTNIQWIMNKDEQKVINKFNYK